MPASTGPADYARMHQEQEQMMGMIREALSTIPHGAGGGSGLYYPPPQSVGRGGSLGRGGMANAASQGAARQGTDLAT